MTRFLTPAAHRLGDGLMAVLWQMILPVALLLVFGLIGGGLASLKLPDAALAISLIFVGVGLLILWVQVALKWHRSAVSGVSLAEHVLWLGSAEVPYPQVRTLALTPTNPESPGGDLSLMVGVGDNLRATRVVLSHPDGLTAFDALRARCPGAVATDLKGVDHEPDDPEHRAAALHVLGRRREQQEHQAHDHRRARPRLGWAPRRAGAVERQQASWGQARSVPDGALTPRRWGRLPERCRDRQRQGQGRFGQHRRLNIRVTRSGPNGEVLDAAGPVWSLVDDVARTVTQRRPR